MKRSLFFIVAIILTSLSWGQDIEFLSTEKLSMPDGKDYFHPTLSPSGDKLALTSSNQQGLSVYDFTSNSLKYISDQAGAGAKVVFSPDEEKVYFTEDVYVQNRRQSTLMQYHFGSGEKSEVSEEPKEELEPMTWWSRLLAWWDDELVNQEEALNIDAIKDGYYEYPYVLSKGRNIIYKDVDKKRSLQPIDNANYLWGSLSPDGENIIAVAIGKGAFVCNTDGSGVTQIGNIESPVWLNNSAVIGMITQDDGHVVTSASLRAINIHNKNIYSPDESLNLMHPSVSLQKKMIAAHTDDGQIILLKYRVSD